MNVVEMVARKEAGARQVDGWQNRRARMAVIDGAGRSELSDRSRNGQPIGWKSEIYYYI